MESDERTYHGDLNRLTLAADRIGNVTRWILGYPTKKNMERLNQIIPLSEVERNEVREAIEFLTEVLDKSGD